MTDNPRLFPFVTKADAAALPEDDPEGAPGMVAIRLQVRPIDTHQGHETMYLFQMRPEDAEEIALGLLSSVRKVRGLGLP